jgi:D-glycero-alpha-D-manno-heptose-7-phosphate kinase
MEKINALRSRAPMRVSFGGGGSEINPYMKEHGGKVMNSTVNLYAHALLYESSDNFIHVFNTESFEEFRIEFRHLETLDIKQVPKSCALALASIKYFQSELGCEIRKGLYLKTHSDAPVGSGLGASSTMTVAIVHILLEYFNLAFDTYLLSDLAYKIERDYLGLSGGIQDHYCAAFGGFNYMEFGPDDHILINSLRIKPENVYELESHLLLIYTGTSRESAHIIDQQIGLMKKEGRETNSQLERIAENANDIKISILKWNLLDFGYFLNTGWKLKKDLSKMITTDEIDRLIRICEKSGAHGLKLCGAGGGGYLLVAIEPEKRPILFQNLGIAFENILKVKFVDHGSEVWSSTLNI